MHQHLVAPPRPITQLRPTVPEGVAKPIGRALAKAPADRWESAERFARALTEGTPAAARRVRPRLIIAASLVAVAVIGGLVWARRPAAVPERPLVAVLPFQNLGAPDDAYFADGVTEEITARLARISGIRIISRTTAMRYRGTTRSLKEIARELGVQYVLEGTIRTERLADGSGQVRVTPDLVRAADDTHLWTDAYTAGLAAHARDRRGATPCARRSSTSSERSRSTRAMRAPGRGSRVRT